MSVSLTAPEEQDRLVRIARVTLKAQETLGTEQKALLWMETPNRVLNDETPLSLMISNEGMDRVENILGRIEWGIYS